MIPGSNSRVVAEQREHRCDPGAGDDRHPVHGIESGSGSMVNSPTGGITPIMSPASSPVGGPRGERSARKPLDPDPKPTCVGVGADRVGAAQIVAIHDRPQGHVLAGQVAEVEAKVVQGRRRSPRPHSSVSGSTSITSQVDGTRQGTPTTSMNSLKCVEGLTTAVHTISALHAVEPNRETSRGEPGATGADDVAEPEGGAIPKSARARLGLRAPIQSVVHGGLWTARGPRPRQSPRLSRPHRSASIWRIAGQPE